MKCNYKSVIKKMNKTVFKEDKRKIVYVHGAMTYKCKDCGKEWKMWLEKGVEGPDKIQPCPFTIACECGGLATHIDWHKDIELPEPSTAFLGMKFFALDKSGKDTACGIQSILV